MAQKYDAKLLNKKNLDEGMAGAVLSVEDLVGAEDLFIVSGNDVVDTSAYNAMKMPPVPIHFCWHVKFLNIFQEVI